MEKNTNASTITTSDLKNLIDQGAVLIDVRSEKEFSFDHASNSLNIPFEELENRSEEIISMDRPVVLCCGSGMRSSAALKKLKAKGLVQVFNAGSWQKFVSE